VGAVLLVHLAWTAAASAQWFPAGNPCATCAPPVVDPCVCAQPVVQTCYQTVPVTEYRPMRQTVQRPVCEVKYVDQPCTEYRPVTETRTASVPTVCWQPVTECRTITRDCGHWITRYECRPQVSPCEYDPRPGMGGWWNRTAYSLRSAFTPTMIPRREYVPRVVAQQIPVTRMVAQHGTQQVSYNVTRMVAQTTTRKVAVNSVRYVAEEVTTMRPVTVMRTVPIGTSVAYAISPFGPRSALLPTPDPLGDPRRTADGRYEENALGPQGYRRESTNFDNGKGEPIPARRSSLTAPESSETLRPIAPTARTEPLPSASPVPSVVRVGRWSSARSTVPATSVAPVLGGPALAVAGRP
jgi:hypothetical protein